MDMKRLKITESQLQRLLENGGVDKISLEDIRLDLETTFRCGATHKGSGFKNLVLEKMRGYGFKDPIINFLKRDELKNLVYIVHTKKVIITITTESDIDSKEKPCLRVIDVTFYKLTQ